MKKNPSASEMRANGFETVEQIQSAATNSGTATNRSASSP